jgi:hypothetical protein
MRLQLLTGLWAVLMLALVASPGARADPTMNAWNQLMIDQLKAGDGVFVSVSWRVFGCVARDVIGS